MDAAQGGARLTAAAVSADELCYSVVEPGATAQMLPVAVQLPVATTADPLLRTIQPRLGFVGSLLSGNHRLAAGPLPGLLSQ